MPNWSQFTNYLSFLAPVLRIAIILVLALLAVNILSSAARRIQLRQVAGQSSLVALRPVAEIQ